MASLNDIAARTSNLENRKYFPTIGTFQSPEGNVRLTKGFSFGYAYSNGYPCSYGNIINLGGQGDAQILVEWSGASGAKGGLFFRNLRDVSDANWSEWSRVWTRGEVITNACWNDYAEFYPRGEQTEAGDIIMLDISSEEEKYIKATSKSTTVVGVHSDTYGHLIGGEDAPKDREFIEYNLEKYIPVGLVGRVNCKVIGKINKGDRVVVSDIAGVGRKFNPETDNIFQIVGMAVENKLSENIEKIKVNFRGGGA